MRRALLMLTGLAMLIGACSGDGSLDVVDAWSRPALGPNGAVYLTIDGGDVDVALTEASVAPDIAADVELHQTVIRDNGLMGMTRVADVEIPAGSTVMMVPGGLHVMLIDLAQPLQLSDQFSMTLTFEDGTVLTATVEVREE